MTDINIGVNLIEILTTGMYKDARTIYREYVQNSCDAIDKIGGGKIEIQIDAEKNYICIEDNGVGINSRVFESTLRDVANSSKSSAENKGFRGIGKLCGLAYCDELKFTSVGEGDSKACWMTFDAENLRKNFYKGLKTSANAALNSVIKSNDCPAEIQHGFKVELFGVTNKDLLDAEKIINYLSEVAPVPYSADFGFAEKIHAHAQSLGCKIDEYEITLNGKQIFKGYKNILSTRGFRDEIFDVSFRDFYDAENNLLAWSWIGLTGFIGQIKRDIPTRAIRLRKGNIQIGDQTTLQEFFAEIRGNYYFAGEIFAVHKNLIPNSQRDYFVPYDARAALENELRAYFNELHKIYHTASDLNSGKKKIKDYKDALDKFPADPNSTVENFFKIKFRLIESGDRAKQAFCDINAEIARAKNNPGSDLSRVILHLTGNKEEITIPRTSIAPPSRIQKVYLRKFTRGLNRTTIPKRTSRRKFLTRFVRAPITTREKLSLKKFLRRSNEARSAFGAAVQKQVSAAEFDETCHVLPRNLQGRCAIFQGRFAEICCPTPA